MSDPQNVKKIYEDALRKLMRSDKNIMAVDADLMRIAGTDRIAAEFPEQYVNAGIAEQNAVGVAAGLAAMGKTVFVSAFCCFLGTRASDQCLNTVCYNDLDVKLIGTYAGISSGINGGTHISVMDLSAFRSMPGMRVIDIADGREFAWAVEEAARIRGPVYIRVPKGPLRKIFAEGEDFQLGKGHVLSQLPENHRASRRIALITSGITTAEGIEAARMLKEVGIPITHLHMTSLKPVDRELLRRTAETHDLIVTADNHSVIGGLGDAVCQAVSGTAAVQIVRLGVEDQFCEGMTEAQLAERHGISSQRMFSTIRLLFGGQLKEEFQG